MYGVMLPSDVREGDRIPMSWEEYETTGEDVRRGYIDGKLVVSPSPILPHQETSMMLAHAIIPVLPEGVKVAEAWAWRPGADEFVPDLMVFDRTTDVKRLTVIPYLAVEVLLTTLT